MTDPATDLSRYAGEHPERTLGRRVVVSRETASTHDDARRLARSLGAEAHGLVVTTLEQTGGRGTRGRTWWSPPGSSLALSVVWAPRPPLARPAALTLAAALAVLRSGAATGASLAIRWPNDVVTEDGRKVAGVLAESVGTESPVHLVGIGVNVLDPASPPPVPIDRPYASLVGAGASSVPPADWFPVLLDALGVAFRELAAPDGVARLARAFGERSWLSGRTVTLRRGDVVARGIFLGLTPALEVTLDEGAARPTRWPGEQVELVDWR
ncbi:MAG: biotin--[acetyl-CoA-carboxylase] ligase [Planctomycetota bacterium JB042]